MVVRAAWRRRFGSLGPCRRNGGRTFAELVAGGRGLRLIYVRTEEMLQAGWRTIRITALQGPMFVGSGRTREVA